MDAERFDTLARSLTCGGSRRRVLGLLPGLTLGALAPLLNLADAEAGKGKKKKKKKRHAPLAAPVVCTPQCLGRRCGGNGCNGTCGACAECQTCEPTLGRCPMTPGSDEAPCSGGTCCGGACCPPSCQCGAENALLDAIALEFAKSKGLPYPACFADGSGASCGIGGGTCQTGTTCYVLGAGVGVCVGLCPGVNYPSVSI